MTTTTAVQAHRGSPDPAAGVRENTLDAFARARSLGADGVELDVRLTADGALAVHHDPVVAGVGAVHELATADLPGRTCRSWPTPSTPAPGCSSTSRSRTCPTRAGVRPDRAVRPGLVVGVVEELGRGRLGGRLVVLVRGAGRRPSHADPAVPTGLLVLPSFDAGDGGRRRGRPRLRRRPPAGRPGDAATVDAAHAAGLAVAAWTVADAAALDAMLDAGVDTVITDDVALARRAVDGS